MYTACHWPEGSEYVLLLERKSRAEQKLTKPVTKSNQVLVVAVNL